jgi:ribosome maturation factor RimP
MRKAPANVQALIEPTVHTLGYELVGVEYLAQGKHSLLRVYIDSEDGITLEDCERVSRQVSGLLDVEDVIHGHYNLEISSPGLDRPLFTAEHYQRFIGQRVKIRLLTPIEGRKKFQGEIRAVSGGKLTLLVDDSELNISLDSIEKANLVPEL